MIRSGATASRQIGARPARDQEQATRSQDIDYSVGFFNFLESEKNLSTNLGRREQEVARCRKSNIQIVNIQWRSRA